MRTLIVAFPHLALCNSNIPSYGMVISCFKRIYQTLFILNYDTDVSETNHDEAGILLVEMNGDWRGLEPHIPFQ